MPAWKRGIIQRRKAKQESLGEKDREKAREAYLLSVDVRSPSDGLSGADSSVTANFGNEPSLSPDPGQWLDSDSTPLSQVSVETIVPVHENPFVCTRSAWKKGWDAEKAAEVGCQEREIEQEVDLEKTIRADNIIITEQDRKCNDERRGRWRETDKERPEEDHQGKRGMKMDLRELLARGGSVTEIRASEVLIIKPPPSPEERHTGSEGRKSKEDGEMKYMDGRQDSTGREHRTDMALLREKENEISKEKERWGQATVIKEDVKNSFDNNMFAERGVRVSQLLSKFGEHPKPPARSKSSDNFLKPGKRNYSGDQDDHQSEKRTSEGKITLLKGVPKCSFSFSDQVFCAKQNGVDKDEEKKTHERVHSDKSAEGKETKTKIKLSCAWLLDNNRFGKHREEQVKNDSQPEVYDEGEPMHRSTANIETQKYIAIKQKTEALAFKKLETIDKRPVEKANDEDGDKGFTVASVKNTEGIAFARRVPIRHDGKAREVKRLIGENPKTFEMEQNVEKETISCKKRVSEVQREDQLGSTTTDEIAQKNYVTNESVGSAGPHHAAESLYRHESGFKEGSLLCTVAERPRDPRKVIGLSGIMPQGPFQTHSVLSQHTQELISKTERIEETTVYCRANRGAYKTTKDVQLCSDVSDNLIHNVIPRSPKTIASVGILPGPQEFEIPRTVFYVAEEMSEGKNGSSQSDEGQVWEEGRGIENNDNWRLGKPVSLIKSLREEIRQKELRSLRHVAQDGNVSNGVEITATQTAGDMYEEKGIEKEREWEAVAHMRKRLVRAESEQEDLTVQTSVTAFDVTQEVTMLKTCPQLPVSVPFRGEEVTSGYATAVAEVISEGFQISDDEEDLLKHVVEQLRRHCGWQREHDNREGEDREEEREELSEEEEEQEEYKLPLSPSQSLSPSQTLSSSISAMSQIYNLEAVGSRTGLCMRERMVDIQPVHLIKVKPLISHTQQESSVKHGDSKVFSGDDICGVRHQLEQFQLKEKELVKSPKVVCAQSETPLKEQETKANPRKSPKEVSKQQITAKDVKIQQKNQQMSESNSALSQRDCSSAREQKQAQPYQSRTVTIIPTLLRSQSPENSMKPSDFATTPASSPSFISPAESPSISPSPTPSPTLFTIRSASGVQGKRGATITITPKKTTGTGPRASTPAGPATTKAQTPPVVETAKNKFPTVEEIEVIGGYQNLEKSCLVKNRGSPKKVKVCFDEVQLEHVCEYPSETSMLACTSCPHDLRRDERPQGEEELEEEMLEEQAAIMSTISKNVEITTGQFLRVDLSQHCLSKENDSVMFMSTGFMCLLDLPI
ncbi:hypothetical protein LDENG_00190740 [Lucifuga dentata]|nr:hypothetical protein LDENG_00190740 [Lucifuga dentata]